MKINGEEVVTQRELNAGDVIEVGKVKPLLAFRIEPFWHENSYLILFATRVGRPCIGVPV